MKSLSTWCAVAVAALILSACAGNEIERTSGLSPTGPEFNRALFGDYLAMSRTEFNEGDYGNSDKYALRARALAEGKMVQPEEVSARKIPADKAPEITSYRGRLVAALDGGAREKLPRDAATAQAKFDCWLEEQEENIQPGDIAACRSAFLEALAKIEGKPMAQPAPAHRPPPKAEAFLVRFDFNRATLDAAANAEIGRAVAYARQIRAGWVVLEGHADRAGSSGYNLGLSEKRIAAVRQAIEKSGVKVQFRAVADGEDHPVVQTADGVREARNRVVIVRVVP